MNETVGDAIADVLVVESLLSLLDLSIEKWHSLYQDLPCLQAKVKVQDKSAFKVSYDETMVVQPVGVQEELAKLMEKYQSRSFIRPSGTEDVVRIYIEGDAKILTPMLEDVKLLIQKFQ